MRALEPRRRKDSMRRFCFVCAAMAIVTLVSCEDDATNTGGPELVTVAGVVRNIDNGEKARGVRVHLLDKPEYRDEVATGTDGAFELKVPKGSTLWLVTDDFNASTDTLFTMINGDIPPVVANADVLDWPIHACPESRSQSSGSLGVYDTYLANQDAANGDIFVPLDVADASGIAVFPFWGCEGGAQVPSGYAFSVSSNETAFPVAYLDRTCLANGWDVNCSSPWMYPPSRTVTDDVVGLALSFGAPGFTGKSVTFTFDDTLSTRNLQWPPIKIPVRPGALSLAWPVWIDGNTNHSFKEFGEACGLFSAGPLLREK
jgi:hypothetical protein